MKPICIVALATVMICISGCGPEAKKPTAREAFEATEKLMSAWDKDIKSLRADYIRVLISEGADVNASGSAGWTPLMAAARHSSTPKSVQLLIEKGAELEARDTDGWTPLMVAAQFSSTPEIVQLLLEKGADVNARDTTGFTPLMFAAGKSSTPAFVELLFDHGAQVNPRASDG